MKRFMWKFKFKCNMSSVAQQLVEFMLIAPFIIIIFGILTEFAYALSINMFLNQGLRAATSSIYSEINPSQSESQVNFLVESKLINYMIDHNIPLNDIKVEYAVVGDNTFFIATYTYVSAFTLPNIIISVLPETFKFSTVSVVPTAFLAKKAYTLTSVQLDNFWGAPAGFSSLDSFNSLKSGVLRASVNSPNSYPTDKITFQVNPTAGIYENISWNGTILGAIPADATSVIVNPGAAPANWTTGCNPSLELAASAQQCKLKESVSLTTSLSAQGNYDNIKIAGNSLFDFASNYRVDTYGSRVFVHPTSVDVSAIITTLGLYEEKSESGFGTKVTVSP